MKCEVIGIMSFKGGVGKTVTSINLGAALGKMGNRILIVDGNFLSPSLHFYLGLLEPKTTIKEIIRKDIAPENAIYEHASGIDIMPANFYKGVDIQKLRDVIDYLRTRYDYIIVDSGPSYTEEIIAILTICDEIIFITTPDYPTLASTVKAAKFAKYKHIKILGLIVNRIKNKRYEIKKGDIEKTVRLPVISMIPEDSKMMNSVLGFSSVISKYKNSKISKVYLKLADKIIKNKL